VTLAVTGNTISGQVFLFQRVPEFERHRLPLTGSRWDIRWLIGRRTKPTFCVICCYLALRLWKRVVTLAVTGNTNSGQVFWFQRVPEIQWALTAVDRKSIGHTMADRSSNEADFLCILLYLAWRLWKSVVTLAVTGNTNFRRVYRSQRVPEFKWHRLPLTGSRWDIRWMIGRPTKPTFCFCCCI
jgi:branched-subunit amino acid transport protein AzlD